MRTVMLWGGALGFGLAGVAGYAVDRPLDLILRDASIGCLAGAWMLRWWWTQLERALGETVEIRRQLAAAEAEAAEAAAAKNPVKSAVASTAASARREAANPALARSTTPASPRL